MGKEGSGTKIDFQTYSEISGAMLTQRKNRGKRGGQPDMGIIRLNRTRGRTNTAG